MLFHTFKCIQRRLFPGLKDLKRKPQFSSCFIDPKCQRNALLVLYQPLTKSVKLIFLLFNCKIKTSVEPCLLVYNLYKYPLQISVCIFRSKINSHPVVFCSLFQKRSAITCLLVFNLSISLLYLLCWCLPCTNISETLFSALRARTLLLATCLLLLNLEITDTELTSRISAFRPS